MGHSPANFEYPASYEYKAKKQNQLNEIDFWILIIRFPGEWVVILVTALKQITGHTQTKNASVEEIFELFTSRNLKMENFSIIFILANVVSFGFYFIIGGFLHVSIYLSLINRLFVIIINIDKFEMALKAIVIQASLKKIQTPKKFNSGIRVNIFF